MNPRPLISPIASSMMDTINRCLSKVKVKVLRIALIAYCVKIQKKLPLKILSRGAKRISNSKVEIMFKARISEYFCKMIFEKSSKTPPLIPKTPNSKPLIRRTQGTVTGNKNMIFLNTPNQSLFTLDCNFKLRSSLFAKRMPSCISESKLSGDKNGNTLESGSSKPKLMVFSKLYRR